MEKVKVTLNKPIYGGLAILDRSKLEMYKFLYDYLYVKFGRENVNLLYSDTDSFLVEIFTEDVYEDILEDTDQEFDTSDYPEDFKTLSGKSFPRKNKKVIGKMKDEYSGKIIEKVINLCPKVYNVKTNKDTKVAIKGVPSAVQNKYLFDDFEKVLKKGESSFNDIHIIRSRNHQNFTEKIKKKILSNSDNKRKVLEDGIHTLPWGY